MATVDPYYYTSTPGKRARADGGVDGEQECRHWNAPEGCQYGETCRFRHGPNDTRDLGQGQGGGFGAPDKKSKPCTKFFSTSGCQYGDTCHFVHYVPGGLSATGLAPPGVPSPSPFSPSAPSAPSASRAPGMRNGGVWTERGPLPAGYKTKLCTQFYTPEGCRFQEKCHFAHGEAELQRGGFGGSAGGVDGGQEGYRAPYYPSAAAPTQQQMPSYGAGPSTYGAGEALPPGVVQMGSRLIIPAAMVGAVIGKAGAHVKQVLRSTGARVSVRDHDSDPEKKLVEIEGGEEQVQAAMNMVKQLLINRDSTAAGGGRGVPGGGGTGSFGSHNFKTRICDKFIQGTCTYGERCHFAHGASDLREGGGR